MYNIIKFIGVSLFCVLIAPSSHAATTSCGENYFSSQAPDIFSEKMSSGIVELCYEGFGVVHSRITATPLWSAEHLTKSRVVLAKTIDRVDKFYSEPSLPVADRAELRHYAKSGYDRGHLSPSADMATVNSQANSFSLSNIFPQNPDLNRKLWADIEATTRALAFKYGDVYVVTGVAFQGNKLQALKGRVIIPTAVYKAIYIPSVNAASAWWAPNTEPGSDYEVLSINELRLRTDIDIFPSISELEKSTKIALPKPVKFADKAASQAAKSLIPATHQGVANAQVVNDNVAKSEPSPWREVGKKVIMEVIRGAIQ